MKTLVVVRHAKSSWAEAGIDDFDRPLNDRGKADAPVMAKRLADKNITPDAFVTSPAKRAHKTAKCFLKQWGKDKSEALLIEKLYEASVASFYEVVRDLENELETVVIFSHNPGITEFVNTLTNVHIDNMPTCGMFGIQADCKSWANFLRSEKKFLFFDYPKNPLG